MRNNASGEGTGTVDDSFLVYSFLRHGFARHLMPGYNIYCGIL